MVPEGRGGQPLHALQLVVGLQRVWGEQEVKEEVEEVHSGGGVRWRWNQVEEVETREKWSVLTIRPPFPKR